MEDENGTTKDLTSRGNGGTYKFDVKGKVIGDVLDDVLVNNEQYIKDYLNGTTTETAIKLKYVCPFIGYILDTHLFSTEKLQKKDLKPVFEMEYGKGTSAVSKLKHKNMSIEADNLFNVMKEAMEKYLKALKTQTSK